MNRRLRSPSAMVLMEFCLSFLIFCLCVAVIVLTTIYSGVEYFIKNLDVLSGTK